MLDQYGADYKEYERILQLYIEPVLSQLAKNKNQKIIWLNQLPTIDFWVGNLKDNVDIFSEKIHKYNLILRRVFRYGSHSDFTHLQLIIHLEHFLMLNTERIGLSEWCAKFR
jgi:hypothetical protein